MKFKSRCTLITCVSMDLSLLHYSEPQCPRLYKKVIEYSIQHSLMTKFGEYGPAWLSAQSSLLKTLVSQWGHSGPLWSLMTPCTLASS